MGAELPLRALEEPGEPHREAECEAPSIVQTDLTLGRAHCLKEGLRVIFKLPHDQATEALDKGVS